MTPKAIQKPPMLTDKPPKFTDSMVEIMDIIKHKGGLNEVIKQTGDKRKFTSQTMTFSEIDGKKKKGKTIVAE